MFRRATFIVLWLIILWTIRTMIMYRLVRDSITNVSSRVRMVVRLHSRLSKMIDTARSSRKSKYQSCLDRSRSCQPATKSTGRPGFVYARSTEREIQSHAQSSKTPPHLMLHVLLNVPRVWQLPHRARSCLATLPHMSNAIPTACASASR